MADKRGKAKNPKKGFGSNKELARIAGKKGGKIGGKRSRRGKAKVNVNSNN